MRTDGTGDAGRGSHDLDRPLWEQEHTGELYDPRDLPVPAPRALSNGWAAQTERSEYDERPESDEHAESDERPESDEHAEFDERPEDDEDDDLETGELSVVPGGSRHAARKAPNRRGAASQARAKGSRQTSAATAAAAKGPRSRGDLVRTGVRGIGQSLITLGLIVLLFVVYELFITDIFTNQRQEDLTQELLKNWEDDPTLGPDLPGGGLSTIPLGEGFAFIRIPAFGADFVKVVIEGTNAEDLEQGPGHYVESAMPGELGNFSLAGHRVGKGSPFLDLDKLQPGDAIVIETADLWFTYRVLGDPTTGNFATDPSGIPGQQIVSPQDVDVVFPIPGVDDAGVEPTSAYLTLTTCHPKFSAEQRLIIHAGLDGPGLSTADYPDGPPAMTEN